METPEQPIQTEEEVEEQAEEGIERTAEAQEEYYGDSSPSELEKESLYSLLWKVVQREDSSKISNLNKDELGMLDMNVRNLQRIALLCDNVGYLYVAKWLRDTAEVILSTSSSKSGWLVDLFVTAKKFSSKEKKMGLSESQPTAEQPKKSGWWRRFRGK